MTKFLSEVIEWQKFELLIDSQIFPINIVLKASYNFLDKGYFFFKYDENKNIILVFTKKEDVKLNPETIIWDFSDELLSVLLRDKLETENKFIRETIVWAAIANSIDTNILFHLIQIKLIMQITKLILIKILMKFCVKSKMIQIWK